MSVSRYIVTDRETSETFEVQRQTLQTGDGISYGHWTCTCPAGIVCEHVVTAMTLRCSAYGAMEPKGDR